MYSQIKIVGSVLKVLKKEFEGKESYQIQMMLNSPKKGFEVVSIKIEKDFYTSDIKESMNVEIPISISTYQGNLFFTCIDKIKIINKG